MASQTFVPALFLFPFFTVIFKNVTLVDWLSCTWLPKVGTFSLFEKFNSVQTELAVFSLAKCDGFKKKLLSLTLCGFFLSHYACTSELYSIFLTLWFFLSDLLVIFLSHQFVIQQFLGILMSWLCPIFSLLQETWKQIILNSLSFHHERGKKGTKISRTQPKNYI